MDKKTLEERQVSFAISLASIRIFARLRTSSILYASSAR